MNLQSLFPLVIPQNIAKTEYEGFIGIAGSQYHIHIKIPSNGCLKNLSFRCDWKLSHALQGHQQLLKQRLNQSKSLVEFLIELKALAEMSLQKEQLTSVKFEATPLFYNRIISEVEQIGWHNLIHVDASFQDIHFEARDEKGRKHLIKLQLPRQYPDEAPKYTTFLPLPFELRWSKNMSLRNLYDQFCQCLSLHQEFWDIVDEIDKKTWVLEPDVPRPDIISRRIALGNSSSLQIKIDPRHPRSLPECKFLGADPVINPMRKSLNSNLDQWDPSDSLLTNLENLLGVTFPSPTNTKKEDFSVECGICYAYRLEEEIPDKACDDTRCGQPFHQTCLYEWLRAIPNSRQSFNIVFGECPYCSKPITVKMPSPKS